jgi:Ca-activated chloride channel family protein
MIKHSIIYILLGCCLAVAPVLGQSGRTLVNKGNKQFEDEKYDDALSNYKEALGKKAPEDIVRYDLGNVYYKKDNYDLAEKELDAAIHSDDSNLQALGYFNRGNARYKQQQFDKSIADYIEVLKREPKDIGAKINLELARRMLQMQQQQQSKQDSTQQDKDQQKQQQQQQQAKQDSTQQDQQQEQQAQQSQQEDKKDKEQPQPQPTEQKDQLSKQDAEKLLNALQSDEKDVLREMIKRQMPETRPRGKDW